MNGYYISEKDRKHLRELAKKQLEYSKLPIMKEREQLWYQHNDLKGQRPMIHIETWTFEDDIMPQPVCETETGRDIEYELNRAMLNHEVIGDDRIVSGSFLIDWFINFKLFDLDIKTRHSKDSEGRDLGHQFIHPIRDLHDDFHLLKSSTYSVDREGTLKWKAFVEEVLGDILEVKMESGSLCATLSQEIVHFMGMEPMIYSLVDYPEEFHSMMSKMTNDIVNFNRWKQRENLLLPNYGNNMTAQGTFGFTNELLGKGHGEGKGLTTSDLWGYMDSQETVSISPDMFGEFFFPYYYEISKLFGLLNYGCCEPVHPIYEKYISKLPNLRKVSISPWCDENIMGEALKGSKVIFHRKPSPNFIGVGKTLDEEAFSKHILQTLKAAKGCKLEFSFRDIYTLSGDTTKPRRAVEIVRQLIETNW